MDWFVYLAVLGHILSMAVWFGSGFYLTTVLPSLLQLPADVQRPALRKLEALNGPIFGSAGMLVVILGAVSGVALGRYQEALGVQTRWGWAIGIGAVLAVALVVQGAVVTSKRFARFASDDALWTPAGESARLALGRRMLRTNRIELAVMVVVIALMTLARFS